MVKKKTKSWFWLLIMIGFTVLLVVVWLLTPDNAYFKRANTWQRMTSPGLLSAAHASLEDNCAACHTSVKGVEPTKCIVCHANNETILKRQVTSFHENVGSCKDCHMEHKGQNRRPTEMDHVILARLGLRQLLNDDIKNGGKQARHQFVMWMRHVDESLKPNPRVVAEELILNCATCHSNKDPHVAYFGDNCVACHSTQYWTIPEYVHPAAISTDCVQCHKTPPAHFMPVFLSMCAKILGKSPASIKQCYVCHAISAWNDIKGAPWHKKSMSHIPSR